MKNNIKHSEPVDNKHSEPVDKRYLVDQYLKLISYNVEDIHPSKLKAWTEIKPKMINLLKSGITLAYKADGQYFCFKCMGCSTTTTEGCENPACPEQP